MISRFSWVLLVALACVPAPPKPTPPEAPALEGDGTVSIRPEWTLVGSAPDATVVRLYLDLECLGPAWRDVSVEELRNGLPIDLVSGTVNVFAAVAIDPGGVVSECSAPVRIRYERPVSPQSPMVRITPALPTRETHFVIKGSALDSTAVRLFEESCFGEPIGTLSAADYSAIGFQLDLEPNVPRRFSLDSTNVLGEQSNCVGSFFVISDHQPPSVSALLRSPAPSPDRRAFVELTQEGVDRGWVFLGRGCTGAIIGTCLGDCRIVVAEFPEVEEQTWSAMAVDTLANTSPCVNANQAWLWDPDAGSPPVLLLPSGGQYLRALVPARFTFIGIFTGPNCDEEQERVPASNLATYGYSTSAWLEQSDGGVVTARGIDADGGMTEPCSSAVPWF